MDIYLMISLSLLLMAAVVAIWFYTSWSVCGAATVISGLGILSVGSMMSYLFFGGAAYFCSWTTLCSRMWWG